MTIFNPMIRIAFATGLLGVAATSEAAFEPLSSASTPVLKVCQGIETSRNPTLGVCRVTGTVPGLLAKSFPGQTGQWRRVRSNTNQSIVANGTTIGTLTDQVWQRSGTNDYVFGVRIRLANRTWRPPAGTCPDSAPVTFEINDIFRAGFSAVSALSVAYLQGAAEEGIWLAGRSNQGINQYAGSPAGLNPARDNNVVAFRTDLNIEDADGTSFGNSGYYFVSANLPNGVSSQQQAGAIRVRQGGEEGQCDFSVTLRGYRPN